MLVTPVTPEAKAGGLQVGIAADWATLQDPVSKKRRKRRRRRRLSM